MATTFADQRLEAVPTVSLDTPAVPAREEKVKGGYIWGALRIGVGWIFLWSFLDKLIGLGFSTGRNPDTGAITFLGADSWIKGGSPTKGFLEFGTKGPFANFFHDLASQSAWIDWVYMLALLLIGTALILGIGVRLAAVGGIIWMGLFYAASAIWPEHNPFFDEHVLQAIILVGVAYVGAGRYLGFGNWWAKQGLVRRYPILK
jgi:thiosulfate dehydrogenase [quinone] large subunit